MSNQEELQQKLEQMSVFDAYATVFNITSEVRLNRVETAFLNRSFEVLADFIRTNSPKPEAVDGEVASEEVA